MNTQTGAATAHGTGRNAPDPGGRKTTASLRIPVAGGTPSRKTMTGLMTGGSPAKSGSLGTSAMMMVLTGAATVPGPGRNAPEPGGRTTTALMRIPAAGGTPSRRTMTGLMTGGSPAMSGFLGTGARSMVILTGTATANGPGRNAPDPGGRQTTAPMNAAGGTLSRRMMTGLMTGGSPAMNGTLGKSAGGEHWICQGLQQQNPEWLRSHAFLPVHAGETAFY